MIITRKILGVLGAGIAALAAGCDVQSGNDTVRDPGGINITGFYSNGGGRVVARNSGAPVTSFSITQSGNHVTAIDNTGAIYRGTLTESGAGSASTAWSGDGPAGLTVRVTGTFTTGSGSTTFRGTWIEPTFTSAITATAVANPIPAAGPAAGSDPVAVNDDRSESSGTDTDTGTDTEDGSGTDTGTDDSGGSSSGGDTGSSDGGSTGGGTGGGIGGSGGGTPVLPPLPGG